MNTSSMSKNDCGQGHTLTEKTESLKSLYKRFRKRSKEAKLTGNQSTHGSQLKMTPEQLSFLKETIEKYDEFQAEIVVVQQQPLYMSQLSVDGNVEGKQRFIGLGIGDTKISATVNAVENVSSKELKRHKKAEK